MDVLSTSFVPSEEDRSRRELLRHRLRLVKNRTQVRNRIHALLDKHGLRVPYKTRFSKKAVAFMKGQSLGFIDDAILYSDLALLVVLDERIGYVEEKLTSLAVDDARVRLLMTMTWVGYFTAMLILAEMVTVYWFSSDKSFSSWMGLASEGPPVRGEDLDRRRVLSGEQEDALADDPVCPFCL